MPTRLGGLLAFKLDKSDLRYYRSGMSKEPKRTVYDLGFNTGNRKGNETAYTLWAGMIKRCKHDPSYRDVSVCERWHNFDLFLQDLPSIPGYALWILGEDLQIDKDIKNRDAREYNLDTVQFVTADQNRKARVFPRSIPVLDLDTGTAYKSISAAARHIGCARRTILTDIRGRNKRFIKVRIIS